MLVVRILDCGWFGTLATKFICALVFWLTFEIIYLQASEEKKMPPYLVWVYHGVLVRIYARNVGHPHREGIATSVAYSYDLSGTWFQMRMWIRRPRHRPRDGSSPRLRYRIIFPCWPSQSFPYLRQKKLGGRRSMTTFIFCFLET